MSTHINNIEINMNADSLTISWSQDIGSIYVTNTIPESITQLPDPLMEDFDNAMAWFLQNEVAMQDLEIPEYTGPQMAGRQAYTNAEGSKTTAEMVDTAATNPARPLFTYDANTGSHWIGNIAEGEILVDKISSFPLSTDFDTQQAPLTNGFSNIGMAIAGAGMTDPTGIVNSNMHVFLQNGLIENAPSTGTNMKVGPSPGLFSNIGMPIAGAETMDPAGVMNSNMHDFLQNGLIDVPIADPNRNVQVYMQNGLVQGLAMPTDANESMDFDVLHTANSTDAATAPISSQIWQQNNTRKFQAIQVTTDQSVSTSPASTRPTATSTTSPASSQTSTESETEDESSEESDSDSDIDMEPENAQGTFRIRFLPSILAEHMENGLYAHMCQHEYDVAVAEKELETARGEANQVVEYVQGELASAQGQVTQLREEQVKLARELREARETLTKANMDGLRKERDMLDRTLADLERFQAQAKELEEAQERARVLEAEKNALQARFVSR
ncbi:hypothetical protein BJX62DRAFT_243947 [Aspergillus germanicus]